MRTASYDPEARLAADAKYCLSAENKSFDGCADFKLSSRDWLDDGPTTADKSCEDYRAFLANKRARAKQSAIDQINAIKGRLNDLIAEHNDNVAAERKLRNVK